MYVQLNGTWLTNANDGTSERLVTSAQEITLNGKFLVQEAEFLRAVAAAFYGRGNQDNTLTFKTTRRFTTLAAAFSFMLTHASSLARCGPLVIICGLPSEGQIPVSSTNGVLSDCNYTYSHNQGVSVTHSYSIRCGLLESNNAPVTVGYDCGPIAPWDITDPLAQVMDGGNIADTFIDSPGIDCGVLV